MKLAILSCGPKCYSTRRLREAALERNHKVKVLDTLRFAIDLKAGVPDLFFRRNATLAVRRSIAPYWSVCNLLRNCRGSSI